MAGDEPIYVTALWYVVHDRKIYLPLDQANRHVKNLDGGGRLSAVVDDGHSIADVRGVNIEGTAVAVTDPEFIEELEELVLQKYFYAGDPYRGVRELGSTTTGRTTRSSPTGCGDGICVRHHCRPRPNGDCFRVHVRNGR